MHINKVDEKGVDLAIDNVMYLADADTECMFLYDFLAKKSRFYYRCV